MATSRRVVPEPQIPSVRLRPVSAPSGSPVTPASSNVRELVGSLAGASEQLGRLSDVMAQQEDSAAQATGQQRARELFESGKSYREAIRDGTITAAESPWFQLGFNEQYGRLSATRFGSDLQREISSGALKDETSMEKFDQFVTQFQQQWRQGNVDEERANPAFNVGFSRSIDGIISGARYQFANQAGQSITRQTSEQTYQEAYNVINLGLTNNDDLTAIGDRINQMADGLKAQGMDMSQANLSIAQAVSRVARDRKDVRIIDALATQIRAGSGNLAGVRSEVGQLFEESRDYILGTTHQQGQWQEQEQEQARVRESRATVLQAMTAMTSAGNPASVDLSSYVAKLQQLGSYEFVNDLTAVQGALSNTQNPSNENRVRSLMVQIFQHTSPADADYVDPIKLSRQLQSRQINNQDFATLLSYVQQRDNMANGSGSGADQFFSETAQFNNGMSRLRSLFTSDFDFNTVRAERASRAQSEFITTYMSWRNSQEGQSADGLKRNDFINKTLTELGTRWRDPSDSEDVNALPGASTDPNSPPWKTQAVMSKTMFTGLIADIQDGDGITDANQQFLRRRGVTPENLQDFLDTQRGLLRITTP